MEVFKTICEIIAALVGLATLFGIVLHQQNKFFDKKLEPIAEDIKQTKIDNAKNYLVDFLDDVEKGVEMSDERIKRGYESYEEYTDELHQNHYVKDKWEKLIKKQ